MFKINDTCRGCRQCVRNCSLGAISIHGRISRFTPRPSSDYRSRYRNKLSLLPLSLSDCSGMSGWRRRNHRRYGSAAQLQRGNGQTRHQYTHRIGERNGFPQQPTSRHGLHRSVRCENAANWQCNHRHVCLPDEDSGRRRDCD